MNMLITGTNGQLGRALVDFYPAAFAASRSDLDISNQQVVENFDWSEIDCVINAAAYTNVDAAETWEGRKRAWLENAHGVKNLAQVALRNHLTIVHISSDYVFDGDTPNHSEEEPFSPLSVYGASKAAGDLALSAVPEHYILRTTWLAGAGKNFVRTALNLAQKNISPTMVNDQVGRLTFTSELVRIIDHVLTTQPDFGTYNATNDGQPMSWADITRTIYQLIGRDDLQVLEQSLEQRTAENPWAALRPKRCDLDLSKLKSTGYEPLDHQYSMKEYIFS